MVLSTSLKLHFRRTNKRISEELYSGLFCELTVGETKEKLGKASLTANRKYVFNHIFKIEEILQKGKSNSV